jgi:hypothetical protein
VPNVLWECKYSSKWHLQVLLFLIRLKHHEAAVGSISKTGIPAWQLCISTRTRDFSVAQTLPYFSSQTLPWGEHAYPHAHLRSQALPWHASNYAICHRRKALLGKRKKSHLLSSTPKRGYTGRDLALFSMHFQTFATNALGTNQNVLLLASISSSWLFLSRPFCPMSYPIETSCFLFISSIVVLLLKDLISNVMST